MSFITKYHTYLARRPGWHSITPLQMKVVDRTVDRMVAAIDVWDEMFRPDLLPEYSHWLGEEEEGRELRHQRSLCLDRFPGE